MIVVAPFSVVRRLLGERAAVVDTAPTPVSATELIRARWAGHVVTAAAAHTPWRSDCYPQALTARVLLRAMKIPHTVVFGLRRSDDGQLRAHAWVTAGTTTVVGGSLDSWSGVASFDWLP